MKIPNDKMYHFVVGIAIYLVAYFVLKSSANSLVIVAAIAIAKEIFDWLIKGSFVDLGDIIATILGGGIIALTLELIGVT